MDGTRTEKPQQAIQMQGEGTQGTPPGQAIVAQVQAQASPNPSRSQVRRIRTAAKKERMLAAIKNNGGHICRAAELAGIDRSTHVDWQQKDPVYARKVQELMAPRLYNAQLIMDTATTDYKNKPELAVKAAMFTLEHLGGELGYQKPGTNVQVNTQVNAQQNTGPTITIDQWRAMAKKAVEPTHDG